MRLGLAAPALALTLLACLPERGFTAADHEAIVALLDAQRIAWNAGDLEVFMAAYVRAPELVFTSGGAIRRGYDETAARYRARYGESKATMGKLAFEILEVQPLGADGAIVLGRWTLTETPEAGSGVFSLALRREAEGWRIVHDHTSAGPKEAPAGT
ncbi:MAG: nuclear transport factor 2 family protein [Nannocystaceae bacterium]